jgi:hypothetical protein
VSYKGDISFPRLASRVPRIHHPQEVRAFQKMSHSQCLEESEAGYSLRRGKQVPPSGARACS